MKNARQGRVVAMRKEFSPKSLTNDSTTCGQQIFVSIYGDGPPWELVWVFCTAVGVRFSASFTPIYRTLDTRLS